MHSFWFIKGGAPMSGKHQGLRYFQKFLNSKASERNALAKKVLRYVMAVGFALSPWLGGEAYATETGSNPPQIGRASCRERV